MIPRESAPTCGWLHSLNKKHKMVRRELFLYESEVYLCNGPASLSLRVENRTSILSCFQEGGGGGVG